MGYAASFSLACLTGGILYLIISRIHLEIRHFQFRRKYGCRRAKKMPQRERIIGWDLLQENRTNERNKTLLKSGVKRFGKYGNTINNVLGTVNVISTIEPDNIKTIMATKFADFDLGARRVRAFTPLLGKGIFTNDGAKWQHSRALLRPNFSRTQIADLDSLEKHVSAMLALMPKDGLTPVDLQDLFFRLTLDTATEFLFGSSMGTLNTDLVSDDEGKRFSDAFTYSQKCLMWRAQLGDLVMFFRDFKFQESNRICRDVVDRFVQEALQYAQKWREAQDENVLIEKKVDSTKERYIFLHEMAKYTSDPKILRDETLNVLLAGRDTTANLLGNLWHELARRSDIVAKLQEEIRPLQGEYPTIDQIKEMKYLRACLDEALRLYPSVPVNVRTANKDTYLPLGGGPDGKSPLFIPKDQIVSWSLYAMHRRNDIYGEDAEIFKPERWESLRPGWAYLPFSGGPRICVGQQFALCEAAYVTIRILQSFSKVVSCDFLPWREELTLTVCNANGVKVYASPL